MSKHQEQAASLISYRSLGSYSPQLGDFVVWAGWFRTWYGVVDNIYESDGTVSIVLEGLPSLLFTLLPEEHAHTTRRIKLLDIKAAKPGNWAVMQHDVQHNTPVWYI